MTTSGKPAKYIKNDEGMLILNPAYREWKMNLVPGGAAAAVVETPNKEDFYYDEEGAEEPKSPDYSPGSTKTVIEGQHIVPKGVAIEMIKNFNGKKNLLKDCPKDVRDLLTDKGAFEVYDKFVQSIYDDKTTTNMLGRWKDTQFMYKVDVFTSDFAEKGIKIALCRHQDGRTATRWFEYIDVEEAGNYVPQYDQNNMSGQFIKTAYATLNFPNGVAVEELKQWGGREKLKTGIPREVEKMLEKRGLVETYRALVQEVVASADKSKHWIKFTEAWDIEKLKDLMDKYDDIFEAKGVDLFISHKQEWISHGKSGGHMEYYRWIEFVDQELQPNYVPQRDADTHKQRDCSIM
jgi:hypothetical protein